MDPPSSDHPVNAAEVVFTRFHKALIFFDSPANWSAGAILLLVLVLEGAAALIWWQLSPDVLTAAAAGILLLATVVDWFILWSLPQRGLSFGSWKSHIILLALLRTLAFSATALTLLVTADEWSLLILTITQGIGTALLLWGAVIEPFNLGLAELSIASAELPAEHEPVRILHITDLHIERLTKREFKLLELAKDANADLILITGDYLNLSTIRDEKAHEDLKRLLSQLSAPHGVFAVLGTPSVDERDVVPRLFAGLEIKLLTDHSERIELIGGGTLTLIGVGCTHNHEVDKENLRNLAAGSGKAGVKLLMYHTPDLFPEAASVGIDLYLCGHTHGGQIRLPLIGALFTSSQHGRQYQMGPYKSGETHMYVSRGIGLEGLAAPRVRFLCPPEITLILVTGKG